MCRKRGLDRVVGTGREGGHSFLTNTHAQKHIHTHSPRVRLQGGGRVTAWRPERGRERGTERERERERERDFTREQWP